MSLRHDREITEALSALDTAKRDLLDAVHRLTDAQVSELLLIARSMAVSNAHNYATEPASKEPSRDTAA